MTNVRRHCSFVTQVTLQGVINSKRTGFVCLRGVVPNDNPRPSDHHSRYVLTERMGESDRENRYISILIYDTHEWTKNVKDYYESHVSNDQFKPKGQFHEIPSGLKTKDIVTKIQINQQFCTTRTPFLFVISKDKLVERDEEGV